MIGLYVGAIGEKERARKDRIFEIVRSPSLFEFHVLCFMKWPHHYKPTSYQRYIARDRRHFLIPIILGFMATIWGRYGETIFWAYLCAD